VPFQGQERYQTPVMPAQGRDPFYTPVPQAQDVPVPQFPEPGRYSEPPAPLQDPHSYHGPHAVVPAVTPVEGVVLKDGEIACDKMEQAVVAAMPNTEYANLRAILWRCCGCGWACHTTFKGLRTHQARAGCGWDSDVSRMTILGTTKAVRPTWFPRTQKVYVKKDYKPSHPTIRPSSPAVLRSATTTVSPIVEQAHTEGQQDAPPAQ